MKRKTTGIILSIIFLACVMGAAGYCLHASQTAAQAPSDGEFDPKITVSAFFEALNNKNYEACYDCLLDCDSLGLENKPKDVTEKLLWEKMCSSYSYEIIGDAQTEADGAVIKVRITGLSLSEASKDANKAAKKMIEAAMKHPDSDENIFDENGEYLEKFIMKYYSKAVETVMEESDEYLSNAEIDMVLQYVNGKWKIVVTDELAEVLTGISFM